MKVEKHYGAAYSNLNKLLLHKTALAYCNERRHIILSCHASPYGAGGRLAQVYQEIRNTPIKVGSKIGSRRTMQWFLELFIFTNNIVGPKLAIGSEHQTILRILSLQNLVSQVSVYQALGI